MKNMKVCGWILLPLIIACLLCLGQNSPKAYHAGWQIVRARANEDGATFAAVYDLTGVGTTNGNYADKGTGAFYVPMYNTDFGDGFSPGNKWMFAFCGEDFNNVDDTFSFNLVGWSRANGMLQVICEGDCVLGTQAVVVYPDGGDALGRTVSLTGVTYTHATKTFVDTDDAGGFTGAVTGMLARVTGTNITDAIVQVTTVTDANTIVCSGVTSSNNTTDATVQINPAFWADTINLDQVTKWSGAVADPNTIYGYNKMPGNIAVINNGDNEVACLIVDLTGLEWIQFIIYDADAATGEEAGNISVYGRRY